ncbi:MAG: FecR domain-containing protein [Anaerohalosphaeraceae bacterium]
MSLDPLQQKEIMDILILSLEGQAGSEDMEKLKEILNASSEARDYYLRAIMAAECVRKIDWETQTLEEGAAGSENLNAVLWKALAEAEKKAPAVEVVVPEEPSIIIQKVQYQKLGRKISKGSLLTLCMAAAAIVLIFLFARYAPQETGIKVAVLSDSINAKWADMDSAMEKGASVFTSRRRLLLREGMVELLYDNQARVTIESPAEFEILTGDQVNLNYGRLYASIPQSAIGFTVQTSSARIIDLGTEFGVKADSEGVTELHVIKGKTSLIAGQKYRRCLEVSEGVAKLITGEQGLINDIPCRHDVFIRSINSDKNFVWRGQSAISLADIAGGGNGFGEIQSLIGLDPGTGHYVSSILKNVRRSENKYTPVADSKFIDGVFIPDGGPDGRILISSLKDTFQCPDTKGEYTHGIAVYRGDITKQHDTIPPAIFRGRTYEDKPIMMIHSNSGITFDLQAIRQSLSGLDLTRFVAFGGLSEALNTATLSPDVDFWVLVDGQVRYEKKALKIKNNEIDFNIELGPQERFLTLIVTDGSESDQPLRRDAAWNNDFFYLIDPQLRIAAASN